LFSFLFYERKQGREKTLRKKKGTHVSNVLDLCDPCLGRKKMRKKRRNVQANKGRRRKKE
jgi:hypothetical protein